MIHWPRWTNWPISIRRKRSITIWWLFTFPFWSWRWWAEQNSRGGASAGGASGGASSAVPSSDLSYDDADTTTTERDTDAASSVGAWPTPASASRAAGQTLRPRRSGAAAGDTFVRDVAVASAAVVVQVPIIFTEFYRVLPSKSCSCQLFVSLSWKTEFLFFSLVLKFARKMKIDLINFIVLFLWFFVSFCYYSIV